MIDRVIIFDTTLRDGEQAPGASMTIPEKVEIAHQLARLGVDVIEAGFPVSSPLQMEGVQRIAQEVQGPVICGLARATELDVDAAGKSLKDAAQRRIHTFIGTSEIHIDGKFGHPRYGHTLAEKRATILQMAIDAVKHALSYTDNVEFSAEDAGRTDLGYLAEVVAAVVEAGATTINLPDTTGFCSTSEYARMFSAVQERCNLPGTVILSTHCHDDLGMAVANSLAGVLAGARQVECTINGIGERAGNASLEEIVMALRVRNDVYQCDTGVNSREIMTTSKLVSIYSGFVVQPNKAIVGKNAFSHEAGIHQDGVLKRRDTYEIMRAEDVGQSASQIRLGRHSGRHGFQNRLKELGVTVEEGQKQQLYQRFLELADKKKEVYDEDLLYLVGLYSGDGIFEHYELEGMRVSVTTDRKPVADVWIRDTQTNDISSDRAVGDGPVDAIYRAISHSVKNSYPLVSYTIRSVTEGQDALGEVIVKIAYADQHFMGRATNTDILRASADAYLDALNHVETYRARQKLNGAPSEQTSLTQN